jgi:copper(I)-binding protein
VRPDAVRFKAESSDAENVFVTAYRHEANDTHTLVIVNSGTSAKQIFITGTDLPASFEMYRTTGGGDNCSHVGTVDTGDPFVLPPQSIVTLQSGGDPL